MAGSQRQESLLTCDILRNGLTLLPLKSEQCQPTLRLRLVISPREVLLCYKKVKILLSSAAEDIFTYVGRKIPVNPISKHV